MIDPFGLNENVHQLAEPLQNEGLALYAAAHRGTAANIVVIATARLILRMLPP